MATTIATYEKVAEICEKLQANDEKLTVRAVHAQTGGGMATVLKHFNSWKAQEEIKTQAEGFSVELKSAIVLSLAQAKAEEQERLDGVIQGLNEQVSDLSDHSTVLEEQLDKANQKIQVLKDNLTIQIIELEKQLAAREGSADQAAKDAEKRELDLLGQIERIQQEKQLSIEQGEVARTQLAKSQLQIERADSAAKKADSMLEEAKTEKKVLHEQIAALEKDISKFQQENAVAQTQVANTKESLKDSHKQLAEVKKIFGDKDKLHENDIKRLQSKLDILDDEKQDLAEKLVNGKKVLHEQIAALERDISKSQQEKAVAQTQVANTKESLTDSHKQLAELKKTFGAKDKSHEIEMKSLQSKLDLLDNEKQDLAGKLISAESSVAGMTKMEEELRSQIADLKQKQTTGQDTA